MNAILPQPLLSRVTVLMKQKLLLLLILPPLFNLCYFLPQWAPIYKPRPIPMTVIDRAVPFQPWWIVPYLSMYLLLPLVPVFATSKDQLRRYALGTALMFLIAAVCFFLWPISYPRPHLLETAPVIYLMVVSLDQPINSLPSLHAGLTAFTMFYAARILIDLPGRQRRLLLTLGWIWAGLILYGTLATKQHYLADLPPGVLLAWISDRIVWRKSNQSQTQKPLAE
jgi:membrane-associated phospholipid phosphatase